MFNVKWEAETAFFFFSEELREERNTINQGEQEINCGKDRT